MSATLLADVANQVKTFWSGIFTDEFIEASTLPALVNRSYEGEIKEEGDTVKITQWNTPTATRRQTGANEDTFVTNKLSASQVSLVANQTITAAYEFSSLVQLQSQVRSGDSAIRRGLMKACEIEINNYLYSLCAPSAAAPTLVTSGCTDFNAAALLVMRMQASQQHWPTGERYLIADPSYYNDLLTAQTLTSSDYVGEDAPVIGGKMLKQRFGFWILEDDSAGMSQLSPTNAAADYALGFHPAFMNMALGAPEFELSSLHSQKRHGFIISVKYVMGAALGVDGAKRHNKTYNT